MAKQLGVLQTQHYSSKTYMKNGGFLAPPLIHIYLETLVKIKESELSLYTFSLYLHAISKISSLLQAYFFIELVYLTTYTV